MRESITLAYILKNKLTNSALSVRRDQDGLLPLEKKKSLLPYDIFDMAQEAYDGKKAATLENVYHRSHERAWDGKTILPMLIEKHGKPSLPAAEKEAVARLFAIILWGELAAWKISLQLADRVVPMEAKMAATSQAFDEARHFYTMHDYLAPSTAGGKP